MTPTEVQARDQRRADATVEERMVLALEDIAQQLALIGESLCSKPDDQREADFAKSEIGAWENEGGELRPDSDPSEGIKRTFTETFTVGPYRYTALADAIAQRRRDALE